MSVCTVKQKRLSSINAYWTATWVMPQYSPWGHGPVMDRKNFSARKILSLMQQMMVGLAISAKVGDLTIQQRDHLWAWASFTRVRLRIRFYLTCVDTEICTVTATTKITTSASLSTARLCHPVTCSGRYLEKPCNVAFSCFPPFISA